MTETSSRHCFAILVNNEPGVLARVIGLFSGRGYNIESLTVDEVDREKNLSRITVVTSGAPRIISQVGAQLGRLIPVREVVNLTEQGRFVESCVAFVKVVSNSAVANADLKMAARKYGARVVDETDGTVIFEITSDFDQIDRFIKHVQPLGLVEVARTGSVAMACGTEALGRPDAVRKVRKMEHEDASTPDELMFGI